MKVLKKNELLDIILDLRAKDSYRNIVINDYCIEDMSLEQMDLSNIDFSWSDIRNVSFRGSILQSCIFDNTLFIDTDFSYSDLRGSSFAGSNLRKCILYSCDARGVNFYTSLLEGTNLEKIITDESTQYFRLRCPESGYFKGYKKCFNQRMVTLLIPKDAGRSSATSDTCRCSKARVLEISNLDRSQFYTEAYSYVDSNFVYRLGEMAVASNYNEDRWSDSTGGIHFYMTWDEAAGYM
jgi:uncharacterized protein YjbI with pentapeptide repeats